jgi:hypothetical protein
MASAREPARSLADAPMDFGKSLRLVGRAEALGGPPSELTVNGGRRPALQETLENTVKSDEEKIPHPIFENAATR